MSAIASFVKMPKTALNGLREATIPKKRFFGAPRDTYPDYLRQHGVEVAEYDWSGYILATLLVYLEKKHQINLMRSDHDELSKFLSKTRAATVFIFTDAHKNAYLEKLGAEFSEQELCDYYNEFNESAETEAGKPMLDGIHAFKNCLSALDEGSVIVFCIG
jgi:hypothetical protein